MPRSRCYSAGAQGKGSTAVEPGNMLWLIQRDFLEGKTVDAMVKEALAPVTNPHGDHDISQVLPSVWRLRTRSGHVFLGR